MIHLTIDEFRGWFTKCPACGVNLSVSVNSNKSIKCILCGAFMPNMPTLKENPFFRIGWHRSNVNKGEILTLTNTNISVD